MLKGDIKLVGSEMESNGMWSHKREAWVRIKTALAEAQKTPTNTGSLKLPSLEEVREAYERHVSGRTFSNEKPLDSIAFIREYIITACKLQAGA